MSGGIPTLTITPSGISPGSAAAAYARVGDPGLSQGDAQGFSHTLEHAITGAIALSNEADHASMQAIAGTGDVTSVVTAVSRAELALQAVTAIRDKVVSAYQTIMNMPI